MLWDEKNGRFVECGPTRPHHGALRGIAGKSIVGKLEVDRDRFVGQLADPFGQIDCLATGYDRRSWTLQLGVSSNMSKSGFVAK